MQLIVPFTAAVLIAVVQTAAAKDSPQWHTAVVRSSHHEYMRTGDSAAQGASGILQTAHEQIELADGTATYDIEQWVVPAQMLRLREGAQVQFAVVGKTVLLKMPNGKSRKLKLVSTERKSAAP